MSFPVTQMMDQTVRRDWRKTSERAVTIIQPGRDGTEQGQGGRQPMSVKTADLILEAFKMWGRRTQRLLRCGGRRGEDDGAQWGIRAEWRPHHSLRGRARE